jgi:hypothetical protein
MPNDLTTSFESTTLAALESARQNILYGSSVVSVSWDEAGRLYPRQGYTTVGPIQYSTTAAPESFPVVERKLFTAGTILRVIKEGSHQARVGTKVVVGFVGMTERSSNEYYYLAVPVGETRCAVFYENQVELYVPIKRNLPDWF